MAEEQVADAPVVETGEAPSDWKASLPDDSNPILPVISGGMSIAKTVISDLFGAVGSLAGRNEEDSEE